jgi:hypothetical protein
LHAEEGAKRSQVLDAEGLLNFALDERQKLYRGATGKPVIDMHGQQTVNFFSIPKALVNKDGMVELGAYEAKGFQHFAKKFIPDQARLLQPVE